MCGITGYIGTEHFLPNTKKIKSCLNMMKDRGPDFQNFKSTNLGNKKILFLFSRLSIIDISKIRKHSMQKTAVISNSLCYIKWL